MKNYVPVAITDWMKPFCIVNTKKTTQKTELFKSHQVLSTVSLLSTNIAGQWWHCVHIFSWLAFSLEHESRLCHCRHGQSRTWISSCEELQTYDDESNIYASRRTSPVSIVRYWVWSNPGDPRKFIFIISRIVHKLFTHLLTQVFIFF